MQFKRKIAVVASTILAVFMLVQGVYGAEKKSAGKTFVPERPVTMIVPTGVGGAGDLLSRTIEKVWNKHCPQPLIIVNKPGSGGVEGSLFVSRSKPDGYTISSGYGSGWDNVAPHMMAPVQYNTFRDLIPVARITMQPVYFVVPADSPFKNLKEVVAWGKKENKPVTIATGNATAAQTLVSRAVGKAAGIEVAIVPFPGGGPAITALVGGHTMLGAAHSSELAAMVKDGRLRVLGIAAEERDKILPNIPTLKEQGINVAASGTMKGIAVPPGTPEEIIGYYAKLFKTICEDPEFVKTMADMMQPVNYQGPDEFAKTNKQEYDKYGKMAKEFGLEYKKKN
jgi:tripartite-type tricarboxylate transporter receptor subunit TctC